MKLFLFAILATAIHALPSADYPDSVVPETGLVDTNAFDPAKEAQDAITVMLQEGKDQGACAALAASTVKEVVDTVSAQQQILNGLDTGSNCPTEGQAGVDAAQKSLDSATGKLGDAQKAFSDAENAPVAVPAKPFTSLKEGDCGFFFSDSAYTSAKATFNSAKDELEKAKGAKKAAEDVLSTAKEEQKKAVKECQCAVRAAYTTAWKAANANNDEDEKAYTKGKHMGCVLEGTPPASCDVGEIPKVKPVTLADGVPADICIGFGDRQTEKTQCALLRHQKAQYLDRQNVKCGSGKAMASFTVNSDGCSGNDMRYQYDCMEAQFGEGTSTFSKRSNTCVDNSNWDTNNAFIMQNQQLHHLMIGQYHGPVVDCGDGNLISDFHAKICNGYNGYYALKCIRPAKALTDITEHHTTWELAVNKDMQYLDRFKVSCPPGKALTKFELERQGGGTNARYNFWCGK